MVMRKKAAPHSSFTPQTESRSEMFDPFVVDPRIETVVRFIQGTPDFDTLTSGVSHVATADGFTIPALRDYLEPVEVSVDVVPELLRGAAAAAASSIFIEVTSGTRTYRKPIVASGPARTILFKFVYEPDPNLLDCPRHGIVRPVRGACPEPPPHTV